MSTFSGLGTALSSLIAQRQGLDVSANNIANANTVGYTRQRATLTPISASDQPSLFSTGNGIGLGVAVTDVARLNDVFLDAQLRTATSDSAYLAARSDALTTLEKGTGEPSDTALSGQLSDFWAAWSDASNNTGATDDSVRSVVLETGRSVADSLHSLYSSAQTQWEQSRTTTSALVTQVNSLAADVADLNTRITALTTAGSSAHELEDQRDQAATKLSTLAGASVSIRNDGSYDVMVGGNALVTGDDVHELKLAGATTFDQATGGAAVTVEWAAHPGQSAGLTGGTIAGNLSVLAPAADGGPLTGAAASYDAIASTIATKVNALHSTAYTKTGTTGTDFFTGTTAKDLTVAITDPADLALAGNGLGAYDSTVGAQVAKLGAADDGPDAQWNSVVANLGVTVASASSRAKVAESARSTVEAQHTSQIAVDQDEETVNMLAYQRAYQGAARVMTTIDEMLETLLSMGRVGR